jgi:hypothetical protein
VRAEKYHRTHRIECSVDGRTFLVDALVKDVGDPELTIVGRTAVPATEREALTKRAHAAIAMLLPQTLNPRWRHPGRGPC